MTSFNEELDLDISNYSLSDILNLFKISHNFDENDLKRVKKQVLMTHPDKSKQPRQVFLFFSKAYKILYEIYTFRNRQKQNVNYDNEDYNTNLDELQISNGKEIISQIKKEKNFNDYFNKLWEKHLSKINYDDQKGYDEWFKSDEDIETTNVNTMDEMNNIIKQRKQRMSALVKINDINDDYNSTNNYSNITHEEIDNYSGNSGDLCYNDLKQAYTETVVPVTEEDYKNIKKFKSVDEMQRFRGEDFRNHFLNSNHEQILKEQEEKEAEISSRRAYTLIKERENMTDITREWMADLLRLGY